jgi:hypothetical protein
VKDLNDEPCLPVAALRTALKFDRLHHATAFSASVG